MPNVIADPEKLRDLAKKMSAAGQQLDAMRNQIAKSVANAGWDDSERRRFEEQIAADLKTVGAVAQRLQSQYPSILQRKARALDEFRR
ncbi:MAG: hypothetical protein ACLP0J_24460 [Solirubrobacteraceae bacterium]|jgi:hypothetical protein